jgi:hypothetical protein
MGGNDMAYVLVRQKAQDYVKQRPVYDKHGTSREAAASKGTQVFRSADDPDEIIVLIEVDDLGTARQFAQSADLRDAMQRARYPQRVCKC